MLTCSEISVKNLFINHQVKLFEYLKCKYIN